MPNVDDKDVDWDDGNDDLDFNEEMSEEEVKRIMESMANKKQTAADDGAADLDVSQWFKIGLIKLKKKKQYHYWFSQAFPHLCAENIWNVYHCEEKGYSLWE